MLYFQSLTRGKNSWSLSEVVHAMVLLSHFHSLSSFVFSCGLTQKLDGLSSPKLKTPPTVAAITSGHNSVTGSSTVADGNSLMHSAVAAGMAGAGSLPQYQPQKTVLSEITLNNNNHTNNNNNNSNSIDHHNHQLYCNNNAQSIAGSLTNSGGVTGVVAAATAAAFASSANAAAVLNKINGKPLAFAGIATTSAVAKHFVFNFMGQLKIGPPHAKWRNFFFFYFSNFEKEIFRIFFRSHLKVFF